VHFKLVTSDVHEDCHEQESLKWQI
jgi:hypothetical protein